MFSFCYQFYQFYQGQLHVKYSKLLYSSGFQNPQSSDWEKHQKINHDVRNCCNEVIIENSLMLLYLFYLFCYIQSARVKFIDKIYFLSSIYLFQVNNGNTRTMCEIYSKMNLKILERRHEFALVSLLFILNRFHTLFWFLHC